MSLITACYLRSVSPPLMLSNLCQVMLWVAHVGAGTDHKSLLQLCLGAKCLYVTAMSGLQLSVCEALQE